MPKQANYTTLGNVGRSYAGRPPRTEPDARRAESILAAHRRYNRSPKGIARQLRYNKTAKAKARQRRYLDGPEGKLVRYLIERNPARRLRKRLNHQEKRIG